MDFEIDNKNIIIYGRPGAGKSLVCNAIIVNYTRIFSNINFFKNWKQLNHRINTIQDLELVPFDIEPWVAIIDEGGVNMSSRRAMSKENAAFSEFLFLWRKKNVYIVWISQLVDSIDKNVRLLADLVINMHKIRREGTYPLFSIEKKIYFKNDLIFGWERKIDLIRFMKLTKREYNTLESSKVGNIQQKEVKKIYSSIGNYYMGDNDNDPYYQKKFTKNKSRL